MIRTCILALLLAFALGAPAGPAGDYRTFIGIARGGGEVTLSPERGFRFHSKRTSDLAYAQTSAPLPMCFRVTLTVDRIDIRRAGCRFGLFGEGLRAGGDNAFVNSAARYAVVFHEWQGQRRLFICAFDPEGKCWCWDGRQWRQTWVPTGVEWSPEAKYTLSLEKGLTMIACRVSSGGKTLVEPEPREIARVRGAGEPDLFAFGDMESDFVEGEVAVSGLAIEERIMEPYLESDMEHVVIREAPKGRYAMYGGLTKLPDGEIACVYKVGSLDAKGSPWTVRDETIVWTRSADRGRRWPHPEEVIYRRAETRQENCCGKGFLRGDGTLLHPFYILNADYEEEAREGNWSKLHLAVGRDLGKSWEIRPLETPFTIAASFGGLVKLRDGTLLLNTYGAVEKGSFRHQAGLLRSRDEGRTWGDYALIGAEGDPDGGPARLNETDVIELPDGRLLSLSRTQYPGFPLYRGLSSDGGRTWRVEPSGLTGLCPSLWWCSAGPPEGIVVAAYHDRWGRHETRGGVYLAFSTDGGATWGEPAWISGGAYPCLIEVEPGTLLCSCYQSSPLLRGTRFRAPFPSGLRATPGAPGVRLEWDPYTGRKAKEYVYRVYRSENPGFTPGPETEVATVREAPRYDDAALTAGKAYYYRVAAYEGEKKVGTSWVVVARAGG